MAFNRKQKLRDNIEAIRTAFTLEREQRTATPEEHAVLRKYCGFGGLNGFQSTTFRVKPRGGILL